VEAIVAKSVRFNQELESLLEQAAQALGVSQSKLIREAIAEKCREVLRPPLSQSLAPFIGRTRSKGGRARNSGVAFNRALAEKKTK
jgi:predicted transcriptional regulator